MIAFRSSTFYYMLYGFETYEDRDDRGPVVVQSFARFGGRLSLSEAVTISDNHFERKALVKDGLLGTSQTTPKGNSHPPKNVEVFEV